MKTKNLRLLIISHTGHYLNENGEALGWIPTVRELDFLAGHFKEVLHLAVLHPGKAPQSTTTYKASNIKFEHISPFGGKGILNKLKIFWVMPSLIFKLSKALKNVDVFQFRAPTSIGLFVIPFLTLFSRKPGWFKYAGNWVQPEMPVSYRIQKILLEKWQSRMVTINGYWPNQLAHVQTFENPCLSEFELPKFRQQASQRELNGPYEACFVGRLEDAKGVNRIVNLLLTPGIESVIRTFHFVGSGDNQATYQRILQESNVKTVFHGFLGRYETFKIYATCHLLLLPSDSEGFPKVIAEAASFGVVPIVSDVSSIGQYINKTNGFLWDVATDFVSFVETIDLSSENLKIKSKQIFKIGELFTFEAYLKKLKDKLVIVK